MTRVVIGLPAYRGGTSLVRALDCLLAQDYTDFNVVIVDDLGSSDTEKLLNAALADPRVSYTKNEKRVGMVENWNRAFLSACAISPEAEFFAWASDHDRWEPEWLGALVEALAVNPAAVLAYPVNDRCREGVIVPGGGWRFSTVGLSTPHARFANAASKMVAGDMIYGLFRIAALHDAGPFPLATYPDRLLLARVALNGEFVQVPRLLWHREMSLPSTPRRQRRTLFVGRPPMGAYLPWWLNHASQLAQATGRKAAAQYAVAGAGLAARSLPTRLRDRLTQSRATE